MEAFEVTVATDVAQELQYLCCYKSYVDNYEQEKPSLRARRDTMLKNIEEAKQRNENQIESEVQLWLDEANGLIKEDTKGKKKWFGLITNCFWQYKRGRGLEGKTQRIKQLIERSNNFTRVARSTGLPGIEFYSSPNFMHFEDRKLKFEELNKALKDDSKFMIGLYGLGGTGKTTMAIQVGKEVEESKVFDKVIFIVVSMEARLQDIRNNIAIHLNLSFKEGMDESEQAQRLWKRIVEGGEKVLIILDDMWEKLTLQDIGIPLGRHGNSYCAILQTTSDRKVCRDMECQEIIELKVLNEKDAIELFLYYAGKSKDGSCNNFKGVALGIVKECGRLPVAIVAVARALKARPEKEWDQALKRLQNHARIHGVKEDLKEAYYSLRLSYDHLKNEKAKQIFLLCSLFPADYEIPIELLTRIAIGLGLCGEDYSYSTARSHFAPIINDLMDACLFLEAGNESVKMHDLVREVALWIGNKQVQVAVDSNTTSMENNIIDFPNHFDNRNLDVLLLWLNNANSHTEKVPDAIFEVMENHKVLGLKRLSKVQISATSLFQSSLSLINVHTLAIKEFELGDITMLLNLKNLGSLELRNCSIIELPNEIRELQKLRLLEIVECSITGRKNPLEVIGSCFQLEELYYVSNDVPESQALQITQFPQLQRYHIKLYSGVPFSWHFYNFPDHVSGKYSISRYFGSKGLEVHFSNEIFKSLVERVEVLELEGDYNRGWTNIVPDILPIKDDGSMEDHLTRLCLKSMNEIKCLIHTEHLRPGVAIFSKLVELHLCSMDVRKLCCGPYPVDFLKQLKTLHLSNCGKLESMLFDGKLELCNLQSICLYDCSMTCLFHPSIAQSLKQLDKLELTKCSKLKYIVVEVMDDHDPNQSSQYDPMFPKLKHLGVQDCPELVLLLPTCFCEDLPLLEYIRIGNCKKLKYIFGQIPEERTLLQMGKDASSNC